MGMKFYRGAEKPKKIRKRFTQSRSWFRTFKWTAYHAHPLNIVGHPFKGGFLMGIGYLQHPDMKRFAINDSNMFAPPRPDAWAGHIAAAAAVAPAFGDYFGTYFAGRSFSVTDPKCSSMLESMKRCWENHSEGAEEACGYYVQGFERLACAQK